MNSPKIGIFSKIRYQKWILWLIFVYTMMYFAVMVQKIQHSKSIFKTSTYAPPFTNLLQNAASCARMPLEFRQLSSCLGKRAAICVPFLTMLSHFSHFPSVTWGLVNTCIHYMNFRSERLHLERTNNFRIIIIVDFYDTSLIINRISY